MFHFYKIRKVYCTTAEETLGYKKRRKDWISDHNWEKIEERKNIKHKLSQRLTPEMKATFAEEYRNKKRKGSEKIGTGSIWC